MGTSSWGTNPSASVLEKMIFSVGMDFSKSGASAICITCMSYFFLDELEFSPPAKPSTIVFKVNEGFIRLVSFLNTLTSLVRRSYSFGLSLW